MLFEIIGIHFVKCSVRILLHLIAWGVLHSDYIKIEDQTDEEGGVEGGGDLRAIFIDMCGTKLTFFIVWGKVSKYIFSYLNKNESL